MTDKDLLFFLTMGMFGMFIADPAGLTPNVFDLAGALLLVHLYRE